MFLNRHRSSSLAAATLVGLLPLSMGIAGSGPDLSFITISPPGSVETRAFSITDSGDVAGLYFTPDNRVHGFLLTRGVYTSIDVPGSIRTNALGATELQSHSEDEQLPGVVRGLAVVGRYDTPDSVAHGYLLRDGGFTTIDYAYPTGYTGTRFTVATSINPRGDIAGRYVGTDGLFHGFTLIDGEFTTVDHPDGRAIHGIAINHRGDLAGYYEDASRRVHGFLLIDGVYSIIDPPSSIATGGLSGILGLNSREMVGFYRVVPATLPCGCDGQRGFIYREGGFTTVDVPGAVSTTLTGVNRRGDIVGSYQDAAGRRHGVVIPAGHGK
jgi:hypothetical protein